MHNQLTFGMIGQLAECDPTDPDSQESRKKLEEFERYCWAAFEAGCQVVKNDLWWGAFEPEPGKFDWRYARKLAAIVRSVRKGDRKLLWNPGISLHECGFNTGDDFVMRLPRWVFTTLAYQLPGGIPRDVMFVSEQGNESAEFISYWVTELAMPLFRRVLESFKLNVYEEFKDIITQVDASLGPAGEIRYPSYGAHDLDVDCPQPGALQCYSMPALMDLRKFVLERYRTFEEIDRRWSTRISLGQDLRPPDNPHEYRISGAHHSEYGRTLHEWYSLVLRRHAVRLLGLFLEVFDCHIGVKIPGVHWRTGVRSGSVIEFSDRLAELMSGLVWNDPDGHWLQESMALGYRPLLSDLSKLNRLRGNRLTVILTCAEMEDEEKRFLLSLPVKERKYSIAHSLVKWIGEHARALNLRIEAENALPSNLYNPACWDNMRSHLLPNGGSYSGLTCLRMRQIVENPDVLEQFARTASMGNFDRRQSLP